MNYGKILSQNHARPAEATTVADVLRCILSWCTIHYDESSTLLRTLLRSIKDVAVLRELQATAYRTAARGKRSLAAKSWYEGIRDQCKRMSRLASANQQSLMTKHYQE